MSMLLPLDDNGNPINVLGFDYRGTLRLSIGTAASVRNPTALPRDIEMVTLIATGPCRFEVGDAGVVADKEKSPFLYPGVYIDVPLRRGERHVAFIAEDAACSAYVIGRI
ncbi:MAG: hypothetical protein KDG89_08345 [Geminicoccaceae bacterium]|nr:hypothetical protein [Geminicoccaceae bacterium]